MTTQF